jgi:hypothetical protein
MIIRVKNNLDVKATYTFLSNGESAGTTVMRVRNINGFSNQWAVQLGKTGEEKTEIGVIASSPSGTSLTLSANTSYDHPEDTPVYAIKFDQIVFERSTSGTAGTASPITNGTVSITADSDFTQFDDTTGASTYAYRTYFRNSVSEATSTESDWITLSGFSFFSLAKIRDRVMSKLRDTGYIKDETVVNDLINEWLEVMNNSAIQVDKSYGLGTVDVAFGTSGIGTITSTDFQEIKRMWITYDGTDFYKATQTDLNAVFPDQTFNETHPYFYYTGDNTFEVKSDENSGTARLHYYKMRTRLSDDTDELPVVMRPYTRSFVNYALAEILYQDNKDARADRYLARAEQDRAQFIDQITPRNKTGVQLINLDEVTSPDDEFFEYI